MGSCRSSSRSGRHVIPARRRVVAPGSCLYTNGHGQHLTAVARMPPRRLEACATGSACSLGLTQRDMWVMHSRESGTCSPLWNRWERTPPVRTVSVHTGRWERTSRAHVCAIPSRLEACVSSAHGAGTTADAGSACFRCARHLSYLLRERTPPARMVPGTILCTRKPRLPRPQLPWIRNAATRCNNVLIFSSRSRDRYGLGKKSV